MDTDRIVLGVDVGGTKIRYGLMDMEGTVLTTINADPALCRVGNGFLSLQKSWIPF